MARKPTGETVSALHQDLALAGPVSSVSSYVYDPLRYTPRMDPGALRTGGKLGKQLTFPGGDPLVSLGSE